MVEKETHTEEEGAKAIESGFDIEDNEDFEFEVTAEEAKLYDKD